MTEENPIQPDTASASAPVETPPPVEVPPSVSQPPVLTPVEPRLDKAADELEKLASSSAKAVEDKPEFAPVEQAPTPSEVRPQTTSLRDLWVKAVDKISGRKARRLDKIMALIEQQKATRLRQGFGGQESEKQKVGITNDDVQKLLRVSDATATRYLRELVKQGRLKQSGVRAGTVYEPAS